MAFALETALFPADRVRRAVYRRVALIAGPAFADRETRVGVLGVGSMGAAFFGAGLRPLWMLAFGPLVLGVPHLLADLRYLVVRQGLHRRRPLQIAVGLPLLAATLWPHLWVGCLASAGALAVARGSVGRRAFGCSAVISVAVVARIWVSSADLLFAHLHNLIAVGLLVGWRKPSWERWTLAACAAAGAALILGGALDPLAPAPLCGSLALGGLDDSLRALAPVWASPALAAHLLLLFAFAQSVHYAIWLRLIPEVDRSRPVPRPFVASLRALRSELGDGWLLGFAGLALGLLLWSALQLAAARDGYLRLAGFHGHLELAVGALLWAERRRFAPAAP